MKLEMESARGVESIGGAAKAPSKCIEYWWEVEMQNVGVDWLNQLLLASFSSAYIGNPNKYVSRWADEEEVAHIVEVEPNDSQKKKLYDDE